MAFQWFPPCPMPASPWAGSHDQTCAMLSHKSEGNDPVTRALLSGARVELQGNWFPSAQSLALATKTRKTWNWWVYPMRSQNMCPQQLCIIMSMAMSEIETCIFTLPIDGNMMEHDGTWQRMKPPQANFWVPNLWPTRNLVNTNGSACSTQLPPSSLSSGIWHMV